MRILFHKAGAAEADTRQWLHDLAACLPEAQLREWTPGDDWPADYALLWKPPAELLRPARGLKAVFSLGAGVDAMLALLNAEPALLPPSIPLIKLDDAGMGVQMTHYVCGAVLHRFRRFDDYALGQSVGEWQPLAPFSLQDYPVGVLGVGALGSRVAEGLMQLGFPVRGWSRSGRQLAGMDSFAGKDELPAFLNGLRVLVNMLPLTPDTENILDQAVFNQLRRGAHVINVARGAHIVDADLIASLDNGQVGHATLDVFREEPLPSHHPFWRHGKIRITPHVSALTMREESVDQIAGRIRAMEAGEQVEGIVDRARGY
jgi:glyoxylate/hydroxypyruvate reductase